jgi:nucleotide-binding universal stress UspA family protein
MERFKRILLFADPAAKIEPVLRYAARIAQHSQGIVTVVDCMRSESPPEPAQIAPDGEQSVPLTHEQCEPGSRASQETRSRLEDICQQLRNQGVPATAKVLVGKPAVEIIREVLRSKHHVVMKTAQGTRANKERSFFGTTAIALMRKCPCPVWVVDPDETSRFDRVLAAVDPLTDDPDHIKLNGDILHLAADLAEWENGTLHTAHAWTPYGVSVLKSRMSEESLKEYIEGRRQHARHRLHELLTRFERTVSPQNVHLLNGDPERAIPDFALQRGIDLIVMGTVGRAGISGFVAGNTAEKVLRQVRCSVLALKPDTFLSPVKLNELALTEDVPPTPHSDFAELRSYLATTIQ